MKITNAMIERSFQAEFARFGSANRAKTRIGLEAALKDVRDTDEVLIEIRGRLRDHGTKIDSLNDRLFNEYLPQLCRHCDKAIEEHATVSVNGNAGGVVVCTPIQGYEPK